MSLKALIGLQAKLLHDVETRGGIRFAEGTILTVLSVHRGRLTLGSPPTLPLAIRGLGRGEVSFIDGWHVFRHSGRGSGPESPAGWKPIFVGHADSALAYYSTIFQAMRQGGVRLVKPDGTTALEQGAPRLRTRW